MWLKLIVFPLLILNIIWQISFVPVICCQIPGGGGVLPEKLGRGVRPASQKPYPIYDQNLRYSLPYLWPDQRFETLFMTCFSRIVRYKSSLVQTNLKLL